MFFSKKIVILILAIFPLVTLADSNGSDDKYTKTQKEAAAHHHKAKHRRRTTAAVCKHDSNTNSSGKCTN